MRWNANEYNPVSIEVQQKGHLAITKPFLPSNPLFFLILRSTLYSPIIPALLARASAYYMIGEPKSVLLANTGRDVVINKT